MTEKLTVITSTKNVQDNGYDILLSDGFVKFSSLAYATGAEWADPNTAAEGEAFIDSEVERLRDDNVNLQRKLDEANTEIDRLKTEIETTNATAASLSEWNDKLTRDNGELQTTLAALKGAGDPTLGIRHPSSTDDMPTLDMMKPLPTMDDLAVVQPDIGEEATGEYDDLEAGKQQY